VQPVRLQADLERLLWDRAVEQAAHEQLRPAGGGAPAMCRAELAAAADDRPPGSARHRLPVRGANLWLAVSAWREGESQPSRYPLLQKMTFNIGQIGVPVP